MTKYDLAPELVPVETRSSANDWRAMTASQTEQIRADYLIAVGRLADARAIIEQAVARLDPPTRGRVSNGNDGSAVSATWRRRAAR